MSSVHLVVKGRGVVNCSTGRQIVLSPQGASPPRRVRAGSVAPGDFLVIRYGGRWPSSAPTMPVPVDHPLTGSEKAIKYPQVMSEELALLLGAYLSEGHTTRSNWSVIITNSVVEVLERLRRTWAKEFGLQARITHQPGRCTGLVVSSKRLVEYLDLLGCGGRASNKRVPDVILRATRAQTLAFLQGVALDAYTTHARSAKWAICLDSWRAIDQLQQLLTRLGIANAQIPKWNTQMGKNYFELYAAGAEGQRLCRLVEFLEPHKRASANRYLERAFGESWADIIPGLTGVELYSLVPQGRSGRNGRGTGRQRLTHLADPRTRHVTRAGVTRAQAAGAVLPSWVRWVLDNDMRFAEVVDLRKGSLPDYRLLHHREWTTCR